MTAVSLVADVLLTVVTVVVVAHLNAVANLAARNADAVSRNAATAYQFCTSSNKSRAAEKALWHKVLATPSSVRLTPAQAKVRASRLAELGRYVDANLAPRSCHPKGH